MHSDYDSTQNEPLTTGLQWDQGGKLDVSLPNSLANIHVIHNIK